MEDKDVILEAMRKAGEPLNAGKVAELTGLDRKAVDKAFAAMKKTGEIVSPVRCHPAKVLSPTLRISQPRTRSFERCRSASTEGSVPSGKV